MKFDRIATWCGLIVFLLSPVLSSGQVKGVVLDVSNRLPIKGATISYENGGVVTDDDGKFSIELSPETIEVRHLGYEPQFLTTNGQLYITILLQASTINLSEVVVSSYLSESRLLETPGPLAIITKKELDRDQGLIITNSLNRIPGVYMHSGTLNTNRITIRGVGSRSLFSTNRVKAYINNIPLTTGEGETTIEDIDLSVVERLEVIKGPASSVYGASLGGVINIKTKSTLEDNFLGSSFQIGDYGLRRSINQLGWGNESVSNFITYTNTHSDGYRDNNEYDRSSVLINTNAVLSEKSNLSFLGQWTDLKSFIPSSINLNTFLSSPRSAAPNWQAARGFEDYTTFTLGTSFEHEITTWLTNSTSVFGSFRNANEVRPFNILRENSNTFGFRNHLDFDLPISSIKSKITVGAELLRDNYNFSTQEPDSLQALLSRNNEIRTNTNLFINSNWQINDKLLIIAGVNLNTTNYNLEDLVLTDGNDLSGDYTFDNILSPRLAINYILRPNYSIHASISHGFAPPTLEETLRPDGTINPDIQPERGLNYEIGSRGSWLNNRLSYDVSFYSITINDLLVARRTADDQFVGINAGESRHQGVELAIGYDLLNNSTSSYKLTSNITYTITSFEFIDFVDGDNDFSGNSLPGNPDQVFNGVVDFDSPFGVYGNVNTQYIGKREITDANDISSESYWITNLKLGYRKAVRSFVFDTHFGINNLLDEAYASQLLINASSFGGNAPRYYYPGLPRNLFGGVSIRWNFD